MNLIQVNHQIDLAYKAFGKVTNEEDVRALQCYIKQLEEYKLILRAKELIDAN